MVVMVVMVEEEASFLSHGCFQFDSSIIIIVGASSIASPTLYAEHSWP